jgi:hypothetical protein
MRIELCSFRLVVMTVKFMVMTFVSTALTYRQRNLKESDVPVEAMTQNRGARIHVKAQMEVDISLLLL